MYHAPGEAPVTGGVAAVTMPPSRTSLPHSAHTTEQPRPTIYPHRAHRGSVRRRRESPNLRFTANHRSRSQPAHAATTTQYAQVSASSNVTDGKGPLRK